MKIFKKAKQNPVVILVIIFAVVGVYTLSGSDYREYGAGESVERTVAEVVDGDTIVLADLNNTRIRYLGVDTPETLRYDSPGDPLSDEAKSFNEDLVSGKKVRLEFDREKYDQYGRLLAYVYADGVFVNKELLKRGLARVLVIQPNERYAEAMRQAEESAKRAKRGMWGNIENLEPPHDNREFLVKPSQATRYINQRVVVRGKITGFRKSKKVLSLDMEGDLDIVIFSNDWNNFEFFDIQPEIHYVGKPVEVIGKVTVYRGNPQIIIDHPILIRAL